MTKPTLTATRARHSACSGYSVVNRRTCDAPVVLGDRCRWHLPQVSTWGRWTVTKSVDGLFLWPEPVRGEKRWKRPARPFAVEWLILAGRVTRGVFYGRLGYHRLLRRLERAGVRVIDERVRGMLRVVRFEVTKGKE